MMDRYNIVLGIASGDLETVEQLRQSAPERIWTGPSNDMPGLDVENLQALYKSGQHMIMGEVCAQYVGLSPSDARLNAEAKFLGASGREGKVTRGIKWSHTRAFTAGAS